MQPHEIVFSIIGGVCYVAFLIWFVRTLVDVYRFNKETRLKRELRGLQNIDPLQLRPDELLRSLEATRPDLADPVARAEWAGHAGEKILTDHADDLRRRSQ